MNTKIVMNFLKQLKQNNNREWFEVNRKKYEECRNEFENFINEIIPLIKIFDKEIGSINAKDCMFRIFRDIRFSNDKTPYKPNFGAVIAKGGRKSKFGCYYIHLEHKNSFLAGGIWMPESDVLSAVRREIYFNSEEFKRIINSNNYKKYFSGIEGEKISKPPKGFDKEFKDIDLLKYKSYIVSYEMNDKMLFAKTLNNEIVKIFKLIHPLNKFINRGIEMSLN